MMIMKEPQNHKEASGSVTIIEEISQSHNHEVKAQEVFSHPDVSDSDV